MWQCKTCPIYLSQEPGTGKVVLSEIPYSTGLKEIGFTPNRANLSEDITFDVNGLRYKFLTTSEDGLFYIRITSASD